MPEFKIKSFPKQLKSLITFVLRLFVSFKLLFPVDLKLTDPYTKFGDKFLEKL